MNDSDINFLWGVALLAAFILGAVGCHEINEAGRDARNQASWVQGYIRENGDPPASLEELERWRISYLREKDAEVSAACDEWVATRKAWAEYLDADPSPERHTLYEAWRYGRLVGMPPGVPADPDAQEYDPAGGALEYRLAREAALDGRDWVMEMVR